MQDDLSMAKNNVTNDLATRSRATNLKRILIRLRRWVFRGILLFFGVLALWGLLYRWVNPPTTLYMMQERHRIGEVKQEWVDLENIAPAQVDL